MKKMLFLLIIIALPLAAKECSLGMVAGIAGDSLILVDGLKIHVPNARQAFVNQRNELIGFENVQFPFTATLIKENIQSTDGSDESRDDQVPGLISIRIRIDKTYEIKDGRAVEKMH
jgi:hypothetical protein